jgi:hypothetical protein
MISGQSSTGQIRGGTQQCPFADSLRMMHSPGHRIPSGHREVRPMIRKLKSGQYRLYSRKLNPRTGKRRNLGTFGTRAAAEKHERAVQFFKRTG